MAGLRCTPLAVLPCRVRAADTPGGMLGGQGSMASAQPGATAAAAAALSLLQRSACPASSNDHPLSSAVLTSAGLRSCDASIQARFRHCSMPACCWWSQGAWLHLTCSSKERLLWAASQRCVALYCRPPMRGLVSRALLGTREHAAVPARTSACNPQPCQQVSRGTQMSLLALAIS